MTTSAINTRALCALRVVRMAARLDGLPISEHATETLQIDTEARRWWSLIKGLTRPRLTPQDVDDTIKAETYTTLPSGKVMVCGSASGPA